MTFNEKNEKPKPKEKPKNKVKLKEIYKDKKGLVILDTDVKKSKLSPEVVKNLTNNDILKLSKEERLQYVSVNNIDYNDVKNGKISEITFSFDEDGNGKDNINLFKKTTIGQILGKEISEIKVGKKIYKRNGLDGEFFNGNRRLKIYTGTKIEILKIRTKEEIEKLEVNFNNEFTKYNQDEKYKDNLDIVTEAIKRGIKLEMIYDLFSGILSKYQGNERKVILEDLFTEIDRVRSRYGLEENSEKLKEYLKDDNNDGELDEIKMNFKDINFSEIGTGLNGLLNFISFAEGTNGNYNAIYGNGEQNDIDFTNMTINEILIYQESYGNKHGSSAIGKYQIIRKTLKWLVDKYGINKDDKFSPEIQDNLAKLLIKGSLDEYLQDKDVNKFMLSLSQIWASIPKDESGISFHKGIMNNNSTVSIEDTKLVIKNIPIESSSIS